MDKLHEIMTITLPAPFWPERHGGEEVAHRSEKPIILSVHFGSSGPKLKSVPGRKNVKDGSGRF